MSDLDCSAASKGNKNKQRRNFDHFNGHTKRPTIDGRAAEQLFEFTALFSFSASKFEAEWQVGR